MYRSYHWLPSLPPAVVQFNDLIDGGGVLEPLPLVLPHLLRVASLQIEINNYKNSRYASKSHLLRPQLVNVKNHVDDSTSNSENDYLSFPAHSTWHTAHMIAEAGHKKKEKDKKNQCVAFIDASASTP